ncbi:hypothetical protein BTVI_109062 [Pitangus sulphuratus]|nr:hypothetical protein BTVI_109062 [Pitangus sulphuratus]
MNWWEGKLVLYKTTGTTGNFYTMENHKLRRGTTLEDLSGLHWSQSLPVRSLPRHHRAQPARAIWVLGSEGEGQTLHPSQAEAAYRVSFKAIRERGLEPQGSADKQWPRQHGSGLQQMQDWDLMYWD